MPTVAHAVIAAAGFGSRLGRGHPKCLVDFRGRSLLHRQLDLLTDVEDVRIVVGFQEQRVIDHALASRRDLTFVRNPAYASTTALASYALGARHLADDCLFMDADIVFDPDSFTGFLHDPTTGPLVGYTDLKTLDPVYANIQGHRITGFSRDQESLFEWANLVRLPAGFCEKGSGAVFEHLSTELPLAARYVNSFEIDRPEDFQYAMEHAPLDEPALVPSQRGNRVSSSVG